MPLHGHSIGLSASTIGIVLGLYAAAALTVRFLLPAILRYTTTPRLVSVSMLAAAPVFWMNAMNLAAISWLARR